MGELQLPPAQLNRLQSTPAQATAPALHACSATGRAARATLNAIGLCGRGRLAEATWLQTGGVRGAREGIEWRVPSTMRNLVNGELRTRPLPSQRSTQTPKGEAEAENAKAGSLCACVARRWSTARYIQTPLALHCGPAAIWWGPHPNRTMRSPRCHGGDEIRGGPRIANI